MRCERHVTHGARRFPKGLLLACIAGLFLFLGSSSCRKVGLTPVGAGFEIAVAAWYELEETLFFFYEVSSEQGLGEASALEVSYESDGGSLAWTELGHLPQVHLHVPVKCGEKSLCGSGSLRAKRQPRNVGMRLRYHRDGQTALEAEVGIFYAYSGAPHLSRSYLVYGVFDAKNEAVQWRGRHRFAGIENLEAERLGLRRTLRIREQTVGTPAAFDLPENPYLYGASIDCPTRFIALGEPVLETTARARWNQTLLPGSARDESFVCARATVHAANGDFTTTAYARKNADTASPIDALKSPITQNTPLKFVMRPCGKTISGAHLDMQKQRLLVENDESEVCLDGLNEVEAAKAVSDALVRAVNDKRANGADMLASIAFHHDAQSAGEWRAGIQAALLNVINAEDGKSSPRLTGAFVFDSDGETTLPEALKRRVLWCPARIPPRKKGQPPVAKDASQEACAVTPTGGTLAKLGPLAIGSIPIFATRDQYLEYVNDYGEAQAGKMRALTFLAPSHTPLTDVVDLDVFSRATFRAGENVQATNAQGFSYCAPEGQSDLVVYRTEKTVQPLPVAALPQQHLQDPRASYELGLLWEFPFLTRLQYQTVLAGTAKAFGATVPFGIRNSTSEYYGEQNWQKTSHALKDVLVICRRFCSHPPFDSAGVYNVILSWKGYYASICDRSRRPTAARGREESPYDP